MISKAFTGSIVTNPLTARPKIGTNNNSSCSTGNGYEAARALESKKQSYITVQAQFSVRERTKMSMSSFPQGSSLYLGNHSQNSLNLSSLKYGNSLQRTRTIMNAENNNPGEPSSYRDLMGKTPSQANQSATSDYLQSISKPGDDLLKIRSQQLQNDKDKALTIEGKFKKPIEKQEIANLIKQNQRQWNGTYFQTSRKKPLVVMKAQEGGEVKEDVEQVENYIVTSAESKKEEEPPLDLTLENVGEDDPFVHDLIDEIDHEIEDEQIAQVEEEKKMLEIVESSTDHWDQELNKEEQVPEPKIEQEVVPEKTPVIKSPPPMASFYQREQVSRKEVRKYLKPFIFHKDSMKYFWKSMICLTFAKIISIGSPFILKRIVNSMASAYGTVGGATAAVAGGGAMAVGAGSPFSLVKACGSIGLWGLARMLSSMLLCYQMNEVTRLNQAGIKRISSACFKHLHKLDLGFHKQSSKNTVFGISRALRSIDSGLRFIFGFFAQMALEFVFLCVALNFYCGPKYFVNMIITFALYTLYTNKMSEVRIKQIKDKVNLDKRQEFYQNESIMNYETVKQFNNEKLEISRYEEILKNLQKQAMVVQTSLSNLNIIQQVIFNTGLTFNLFMAATDVYTGRLTPGDFVLIQALFLQLAGPLFNLGTLFRQIDETSVDVEELFHMLKSKPFVKEKEDAVDFKYKEGKIKIENLGFKHYVFDDKTPANSKKEEKSKDDKTAEEPEFNFQEKELLKDFSLEITPGTTNAIVGSSGFGKTTLFNLLFRIYAPEKGRILIDDQDIADLKFDSFRKYISIIPQNGILFNDTILFNLHYGNPDATLEETIEVCKKCEIHDKIMKMKDGYSTKVGDLGGKLSGGERQRILIARGLLKKDAQIYLFDEATSSLDAYTEKQITGQLDKLMKGKTVIYCAHRLSSIINVDKIHVLKGGKVVEQGKHAELMKNPDSEYKQMWRNYLREEKHDKIAVKKEQEEHAGEQGNGEIKVAFA